MQLCKKGTAAVAANTSKNNRWSVLHIALPSDASHTHPTTAMLHLSVLASGSSGNCALVETASTRILVDAGLSARKIAQKLEAVNVSPESIDGILLTHEHSDHSQGVASGHGGMGLRFTPTASQPRRSSRTARAYNGGFSPRDQTSILETYASKVSPSRTTLQSPLALCFDTKPKPWDS